MLPRRADAELTFVEAAPAIGPPLLLDSCVHVDALEGSLPAAAEALLRARTVMHLSVVLGELAHNFGRLNPGEPRNAAHPRQLAAVIGAVPRHRLEAPGAGLVLEAGILAGLLFRLRGLQPGREVAALNDATIYLHALERGQVVLTRNIGDFDAMQQLVPAGRVIFYRVD